jgi:hypothetical protein
VSITIVTTDRPAAHHEPPGDPMSHLDQATTAISTRALTALRVLATRLRGEAGEGVISAAIVVLIMALIGAAMWVAFNGVFQDASGRVSDSVSQIGG